MEPFGALIVGISTIMHASWNLIAKRARATIAFLFAANFLGAILVVPLGIWSLHAGIMNGLWVYAIASGVALAAYFAGLGLAYERGDMSVIYPLIRATPVIIVAGIKHFTHQETITPPAFIGILLVTAGCIILGFDHSKGADDSGEKRKMNTATILLISLAVIATVGFSLIDKAGMHKAVEIGGPAAFVYGYWEFVFTSAVLLIPVLLMKGEIKNLKELKPQWHFVLAFSLLNMATYCLVLWGMQSCKISYLVAFRQLSIVWGVILAGVLLKEPRLGRRLALSLIIVAGIFLVGLGDPIWNWLQNSPK